jgi:methionyl-tRNA synthetase
MVGKDILRFHAVYWPAFLMAAGIELPKSIIAHGWWTNEGQKISKSIGNVIDPFELVEEFGLDQVRYFLMREITLGNDGNFAKSSLVSRNNSELSNKIGNLLQRTSSFAFKYCDKKIPAVTQEYIDEAYSSSPLLSKILLVHSQNLEFMQNFQINKVLDNIIHVTEQANIYMDKEAPWALKTTDPEKMQKTLYSLLEVLRYIGIMLQPFVPSSAGKMLDQLGVPGHERNFANLTREFALSASAPISQPVPIFPRLEK